MDKRRGVATVLLLVIIVAVGPMLGSGAKAGEIGSVSSGSQTGPTADGEVIEVSDCRTIDEPGRYVLTEDITDSSAEECITIVASDVVFDGQGHTLDARQVDHQTEAIAAGYTNPPIKNVTIRNLVVTDWTQGVGCREVASDVTIENVTARRNGLHAPGNGYGNGEESYGIYIGDLTRNVTVTDSIAVNNSQGIFIANTSNNTIRANLVQDNEAGGIILGGDTWRNSVVDNRIVDNEVTGIEVTSRRGGGASNQTTISGNSLRGNERGILLEHTNTTINVVNNQIRNSTRESLWVAVVDGDVTIAENGIHHAKEDGIVLDATNNVVVRNNTIRDVAGAGIFLKYESRENVLRNNHVVGTQHGLHITDESGESLIHGLVVRESRNQSILFDGVGSNRLVDTTVRGGDGIEVKSPGNQLRNITVTDTRWYGLRLQGANNTRIETVTARNTGAHAYEAVGRTTNVTLRNLSLASGRISFTGADAVIAPVDNIPTPPAGKHDLGVAVRIRATAYTTTHDKPAVLTIHYPGFDDFEPNMTLWHWSGNGVWTQFDTVTVHPERNALSAPLPTNTDLVVVPLAGRPPPTATPTPTPTMTPTATPPHTPTPTATMVDTPGFGVGVGLLVLLLGALLGARPRQ